MDSRLVFRDAAGRELTADDLKGVTGRVRFEVIGAEAIPAEASRLHSRYSKTLSNGFQLFLRHGRS